MFIIYFPHFFIKLIFFIYYCFESASFILDSSIFYQIKPLKKFFSQLWLANQPHV